MWKLRLCPFLRLFALLLIHSPAEAQNFGHAAWIRQAWTDGETFIPMDITIGPGEEVIVTGHMSYGKGAFFEAGSMDSLNVRGLDVPPENRGFIVGYSGGNGDLMFTHSGSVLSGTEPGYTFDASDYSAGFSVTAVGDRLFHGEGPNLRNFYESGSAMVTVRDLEGSVVHRIGPRERRFVAWDVFIQGIGFDAQENVYMAGTYKDTLFFGPDIVLPPSRSFHHASWDVFMASYSPNGTVRWAQQIEDGGTGLLRVSLGPYGNVPMDVDATGQMVLGALFYGRPPAPFNAAEDGMVLATYASDGTLQRTQTLKDFGISYEPSFSELRNEPGIIRLFAGDYVTRPLMIRRDSSDNLYVVWYKRAASDRTNALTVSDSTFHGRGDRAVIVLTRLDAQGTPVWAREFRYDWVLNPTGMEVTEQGQVYVWGSFWGHYLTLEGVELTQNEVQEADGFVAHYDKNGNVVRTLHLQVAGDGVHAIEALTIGHSGDVYVAGRYMGDMAVLGVDTLHAQGENNLFIAKYSATSLSSEPSVEMPTRRIEVTNYPNPFHQTTTITYSVPAPGHVRLAVYDVLGREVAVLVDERKGAGSHYAQLDASAWPSGVYLYRLEAGNQVATGRLVRRK